MLRRFLKIEEYVYLGIEYDQLFKARYYHKGKKTCRVTRSQIWHLSIWASEHLGI